MEAALAICRVHMGGRRENAWAHVCAGHALAHLGMADEAEAALWDAIRADPDSPLAYLELGHLALIDGRYGDAGGMYARSAEIDPSYAPAYVFRGNALLMTEGADGRLAVEMYEGAPVVDPYDITAHMGRGLSLAGRGLHAEAAVHFERAIDVDPDDAVPRVALGHAMAALGRDAEAAWAYAAAIERAKGRGSGSHRPASGSTGHRAWGTGWAACRRTLDLPASCRGRGDTGMRLPTTGMRPA